MIQLQYKDWELEYDTCCELQKLPTFQDEVN